MSRAISPKAAIVPITVAWQVNELVKPRLILKIHLNMASLVESENRVLRYMLTLQSIHNVVCGLYPTTVEQAVKLASIQLQSRFGDYNPDT